MPFVGFQDIHGYPMIIHDPFGLLEDLGWFEHQNAKHLESLPGWEAHPGFGAAKKAAVIR